VLEEVLRRWAEASPKPLVLLIDEIDALIGDTLISVLRQIRAGYPQRPALFPQSIVLCGVCDVRDYRIHSDRDKAIITQDFFRQHSEHWIERFDYKEARPQLLLQVFLQRIVNSGGGGRIEREYGLGRLRTDLLLFWPYPGGVQQVVIELKLVYGSLSSTIEKGLEQTAEYADRCGADEAHLVIFDRDKSKTWQEKIFSREETYQGRQIKIWGM